MSSRIAPLLEPYLGLPPEASIILLTSVLGASSNWLVLRFLHRYLLNQDVAEVSPKQDTKVLLVSFMRDMAFWRENAKRIGMDLDKLAARKRFGFVDGLTGLYLPKQKASSRVGETLLTSSSLASVSGEINRAVQALKEDGGQVILFIDQLDLLLVAGGDQIGAVGVGEMLMGLQVAAHATVLTMSADYPLVAAHQTPLETDHAGFLLGLAHQADLTVELRLLDSGTARDVSGVLTITVGDQAGEDQGSWGAVEEKELLYFVGGDGGVKVFERGQ